MPIKNYYTILGLDASATQEDIKLAYRKLVRQFHPDRNHGSQSYEDQFKLIQEAYEILSDKQKRDNYDAKLAYDTYINDPVKLAKFLKDQKDKPKKYKKPAPEQKHPKRTLIINSGGALLAIIVLIVGVVNVVIFKKNNSNEFEKNEEFRYNDYTHDESSAELATEYFEKAKTYLDVQNFKFALIYFNKALEISPNDPKLYFNRGLSYYLKENYDLAVKDFNKTISLDPNYKNAYWIRAKLKYDLDDNKGSINDFSKAIELDPNNDSLYFNRGLAYYYIGEYEKAVADINMAIQINPEQPQYYFDRGDAKEMTGESEGCSDWQKAKELGYSSSELKLKNCIAPN